jgi:hypothetical protein
MTLKAPNATFSLISTVFATHNDMGELTAAEVVCQSTILSWRPTTR